MKIAYWPPLILLFTGGAFYFNGRLLQEQPSKTTPTPASSQPEVPAKKEKETSQEQPSSPIQGVPVKDEKETNKEQQTSTQQELPVKDKAKAKAYKLF